MAGSLQKTLLDNKNTIIIFVSFIIIIFADYSLLIRMQLNHIKTVKPKIEKLNKDIDDLNKSLSGANGLNSKQNQRGTLNMQIISKGQLPLFLQKVSVIANSNNVKLMQIKSVNEKEGKKKDNKGAEADKFDPLYITLDLLGNYHDLGRFINGLENADSFIALQDIDIKQNIPDSLQQSANLLLKTYVKK